MNDEENDDDDIVITHEFVQIKNSKRPRIERPKKIKISPKVHAQNSSRTLNDDTTIPSQSEQPQFAQSSYQNTAPMVPHQNIPTFHPQNIQANFRNQPAEFEAPNPKHPLTFQSCVLFPPNQNITVTRGKPEGCKTIFIAGLPENVTEKILQEVFKMIAGPIAAIRLSMSKKNFCHIRFKAEKSVDCAVTFSGYIMQIGNQTDLPNTGKLYIDFALARDDQIEFRSRQWQLDEEHRRRTSLDTTETEHPEPDSFFNDELSAIQASQFTEHDAHILVEDLKKEDRFNKSVEQLIRWFDLGECTKRNSSHFYSMIQSTYAHSKKFIAEKKKQDEALAILKQEMNAKLQIFLVTFGQIERVFVSASRQRSWDQFTKAQRKNITQWKSHLSEIRRLQIDLKTGNEAEEEMELCDDENESTTADINDDEAILVEDRKVENNSEKPEEGHDEMKKGSHESPQLLDKSELETKNQEIELLRKTLQGTQMKLLELQRKVMAVQDTERSQETKSSNSKIIALFSIFLHANPRGCSLSSLLQHLNHNLPNHGHNVELEDILKQNEEIFCCLKKDDSELVWTFCGFN